MIEVEKVQNLTNQLSVLYLEDDEYFLDEMSNLLNDFFKVVVSIKNGRDGLEKYKEYYQKNLEYFDIVITDINMPYLDGLELSKKILQINKTQKIIVVSAYKESTYIDNFKTIGINNFIFKPMELDNILNTLYNVSSEIS